MSRNPTLLASPVSDSDRSAILTWHSVRLLELLALHPMILTRCFSYFAGVIAFALLAMTKLKPLPGWHETETLSRRPSG